jgi:hypothetical protein
VFLTLQLALPISRLGPHESARRFGWQMFSIAREDPTFVVETESGQSVVDLNEYMAGARGDVDIVGALPTHLCVVYPGAVRVTWESGAHEC